uniref:Uncharacterized protein n=1 Tax=Lygus hesperus TaxID=30085 RepID=A0A0K8T5D1_LYGHE
MDSRMNSLEQLTWFLRPYTNLLGALEYQSEQPSKFGQTNRHLVPSQQGGNTSIRSNKNLMHRPSSNKSGTPAPRLFKMSANHAFKLSQQFAGNPDAMFTYVSPTPDPEDENAHVWVAMGTEEAEYAGLVNMVRESSGPPHACSMTEGEPEPWN